MHEVSKKTVLMGVAGIAAAGVALAAVHAFSEPAHPLLSQLKEGLQYVDAGAVDAVKAQIEPFKEDPKDIQALEKFAQVANQLYSHISRSDAETVTDQEVAAQQWAMKLRSGIYEARDGMLKADPSLLEHFSVSAQYGRLNAEAATAPVPPELKALDQQQGTVLFTSNQMRNDCGAFADKLYRVRQAELIDQFLAQHKDSLTPESADQLVQAASVLNRVQIKNSNPNDTWNHHARTQIAGAAGSGPLYALEAHSGKPFLLAPELHQYADRQAFMRLEGMANNELTLDSRAARDIAACLFDNGTLRPDAATKLQQQAESCRGPTLGITAAMLTSAPQKRGERVDRILADEFKKKLAGTPISPQRERKSHSLF